MQVQGTYPPPARGGRLLRLLALLATLLPLGAALAQEPAVRRTILINNRCSHPLRLLVHHADGWRNWHPHGWYTFDPGERSTLQANNITLTQSDNHELYIYAETTDNSGLIWEGQDATVEFAGQRYGFVKANTFVEGGRLNVVFNCRN